MCGFVLTSHGPWQGKAFLLAIAALGIVANAFEVWKRAPGGTAAFARVAARVAGMEPSVFKSFLGIVLTRPTGLPETLPNARPRAR
jgi:hypothetical protein